MTNNSKFTIYSNFVSLLGAPNAGKSTLVNRLIGAKVSIVTHKVQTTRVPVRGIITHNGKQIVLIDTPGVSSKSGKRNRISVATTWNSIWDTDTLLLIVVDAQAGYNDDVAALLAKLKAISRLKVLVLNKIDRINRQILLALTATINEKISFERIFMVSALNGSGCHDVLDYLAQILPAGPRYYPEGQISDMPMRKFVAEITREKLYLRVHDELPYVSTVETERWEERMNGSVLVEQVIYVENKNQKKILLGYKGGTIREIGYAARKEISEIIEQHVHLFLFVKVRNNWSNNPELYHKMDLDFSG